MDVNPQPGTSTDSQDQAENGPSKMPLMKIPDSVLESLHCQGKHYLSKSSGNIQNGKTVSGNCTDSPSVAVSRNSQYEALAGLFLFPCRYKLQGCPKYIQFNRLENHESECSYRIYECPVNLHSVHSCTWKGTTLQLCQHYEDEHPELYLQADSPRFKLNFNDHEIYRLIKVEDILFLLQTKYSLEAGKMWFNMVCFKQEDRVKHINYAIRLNSGGASGRITKLEDANPLPITKMQLNPSLSLDVNIQAVKYLFKHPDFLECQWDISVTEELKVQIKAQQELEEEEVYKARNEDIQCINCGCYMVPPIHRCNKGHKTCVDCKGYYNECKSCQNNLVGFTVAEDLEEISKSEQHYCRWIKCKKIFSYSELREHEQNCPHRIYNCPHCNIWSGELQQLSEHFLLVHPKVSYSRVLPLCFDSNTNILTYAIAHNEIFQVNMDISFSTFDSCMNINVCFFGSPQFANCWEYEVAKNGEKIQTQFVKQMANNYSCKVVINKLDEINTAFSEAKTGFTFNASEVNLPTTEASNSSVGTETQNPLTSSKEDSLPVKSMFSFGIAASNTTQNAAVAPKNSSFGSAFVTKPKSAQQSASKEGEIFNSARFKKEPSYTLNISKIKN